MGATVLPEVLRRCLGMRARLRAHPGLRLCQGGNMSRVQIDSQAQRHCSWWILHLCMVGFFKYIHMQDYYVGAYLRNSVLFFSIIQAGVQKTTCNSRFPPCLEACCFASLQKCLSSAYFFFFFLSMANLSKASFFAQHPFPCSELCLPAHPLPCPSPPGFATRGHEAGRDRWAPSRERQWDPPALLWDFFRWLK